MKFITTNFVKCAIKSCDSSDKSFPLQYSECQLVQEEQDFNGEFIASMLEGIDPIMEDDQAILKDLHTLLVETQIVEGKMTCGNCGHIYYIKNSIPNFLLPPHLCQ